MRNRRCAPLNCLFKPYPRGFCQLGALQIPLTPLLQQIRPIQTIKIPRKNPALQARIALMPIDQNRDRFFGFALDFNIGLLVQPLHHTGAIARYLADLDCLDDLARIILRNILTLGPVLSFDSPAWLHITRPRRVVRSRPALFLIPVITPRIKRLLPSGRRNIQAVAGQKINPCDNDMKMVIMPNNAISVFIGIQASKRNALKVRNKLLHFLIRTGIIGMQRNHAGCISVNELKRVNQPAQLIRVAAQYLHQLTRSATVIQLAQQIFNSRLTRTS